MSEKNVKLPSLQGLRGLASLTIVVSHFLGAFYLSGADLGTPLELIQPVSHLFGILANKAVWIFFVLSGFVLTVQLSSRQHNYLKYLFSRLVRLYIPVWIALLFNLFVVWLISSSGAVIKFWIGAHPNSMSLESVLWEFSLMPDGYLLGPLWTLKWEVIFSVFAYAAWKSQTLRSFPKLSIALSLLISALGEVYSNGWAKYIPMFVIGVSLYFLHSNTWSKNAARLSIKSEFLLLAVATILPVIGYVLSLPSSNSDLNIRNVIDVPLSLVSITIVFYAISTGTLIDSLLKSIPMQKLGEFSFSLYLMHLPVIFLSLYLSGFSLVGGLIGLALCFPVAYVTYYFIERPVQIFSRQIRSN